jgi:hypothetical protein
MRQVELPPKGGGIVTEVGIRWTLPLRVAMLRLPFFLMSAIVSCLLFRSRYCLVHFRPVDYCSSRVIVFGSLLFWSPLLFSRFR